MLMLLLLLLAGLRVAAVVAVVGGHTCSEVGPEKKVEAQRKTHQDKLPSRPNAWVHLSKRTKKETYQQRPVSRPPR